jgi:hypothetical protein
LFAENTEKLVGLPAQITVRNSKHVSNHQKRIFATYSKRITPGGNLSLLMCDPDFILPFPSFLYLYFPVHADQQPSFHLLAGEERLPA